MKLTTPQAAAKRGIGVGYVGQLCASGKITAKKVGRDWHITAAALQRYSEGRRGVGRPLKGVKG